MLITSTPRRPNGASTSQETPIATIPPLFSSGYPNALPQQRAAGTDRLRRFLNRLKASRLPASALRRMIYRLRYDRQGDSAIPPFHFEEWRKIPWRFDPSELDTSRDWAPLLGLLKARLIDNPVNGVTSSKCNYAVGHRITRKAAALSYLESGRCTGAARHTAVLYRPVDSSAPSALASSPRGEILGKIPLPIELRESNLALVPAENCDSIGPDAEIRALYALAAPVSDIKRFPNLGDRLNILRHVQDILSCVASVLQFWGLVPSSSDGPLFPPCRRTGHALARCVSAWPYVRYVRKPSSQILSDGRP